MSHARSGEIVKFPYRASRRVVARRPRRSKNGTPEERAANAAASDDASATGAELPPASAGEPATQAQRNAIRFEAIKAKFNWSNEDWADHWLPWVRIAAVHVAVDDNDLADCLLLAVKTGEVPNLLNGWSELKEHLTALSSLAECALSRSFLVLERLGYSPDNPPPDQPAGVH